MSDRDNSSSFLWFLAGLGFGALMGVFMLLAPDARPVMPSRTLRAKARII